MKKIFNFPLFILIQASLILCVATTSCSKKTDVRLRDDVEAAAIIEKYDTVIPQLMEEQKIPALSIALIDKKGTVWANSYGYTDTKETIPNTSETLFSIQSTSKTITATALMIAVQDGLVDLDTPIVKYLPDFKLHSLYDKNPQEIITLRHLLSHTAGLAHRAPVGNNFTYDAPSFEEHVNSIQQTSSRYPVGQRYSYSNLGSDLAAYILQVVSGKPFHQYLEEKIFRPLGMTNSTANPEVIQSHQNRAPGHNGGRKESRMVVPMQGAGGVYSCIDDMAKFVQLHLNSGKLGDEEFINPSILEEMYTVPFPAKGQIHGYALGIDTMRKYDSLFLFHHGGGYGYLVDMAWYQNLGIGIVILTNSADHDLQGKLYNQILDEILHPRRKINQKAPAKDIIVEPTIEALRKLSGNYVDKLGTMELVLKEDTLCRKNGNEFIPFVFYSENEAYLDRDRYYYYRFEISENGFPDYLIRLNNGATWDYNDGPNDQPGPDKPEWEKYTGTYNVYVGGNQITTAKLEMRNGYLYISYLANSERLKELKPGTFINCKGEILLLGERNIFASVFELVKK